LLPSCIGISIKGCIRSEIKQVTTSHDIPHCKNLKVNWKNIDPTTIQCYRKTVELFRTVPELEHLPDFYRAKLKNAMVRKDYRELIELSIVFLGGHAEKTNIRPPGVMHQARYMARAIYSLKLLLFSSQLKLNTKDKAALLDVFLFIMAICVKPWFQCVTASKEPYKDLCFLKSLKSYENVNESFSKGALQKLLQNSWYLTDKIAVLSHFDNDVDEETKLKMVTNLQTENFSTYEKRYIPSK
jgi:hypothetical protein